MAIQRAQEDSWTREMAKWEQRPVLVNGTYVQPIPVAEGGKGGFVPTEYPKMIYRAESADGGPRIAETKIVHDSLGESVALGQGWSLTQEAAIAAVGARQLELAKAAANRVYNERWMSEAAKAEARAADETTIAHLGEIPATPIKKRGRPKQAAAPVSA